MENRSLAGALMVALLLVTGARAAESSAGVDAVAERYVRLQLAIGVHDPDHEAARFRLDQLSGVVPPDRVAAVMQAAVDECRRRPREHIELPTDL